MRFLALCGAVAWAFSAPLSKRENLYFYAQAFYLCLTELYVLAFDDRSLAYGVVYELLTGIILLAVILITVENRPKPLVAFIGCCSAAVVFLRAYEALAKPLRYFGWGYLVEGSFLIGCGFILIFCYVENYFKKRLKRHVVLTLGLLWVLLGLFRLGFVLQLDSPIWLRMNWVVPSWLAVAAFILVGIYGRKERQLLAR